MIKGFWIVPGWITHMYILDKPFPRHTKLCKLKLGKFPEPTLGS